MNGDKVQVCNYISTAKISITINRILEISPPKLTLAELLHSVIPSVYEHTARCSYLLPHGDLEATGLYNVHPMVKL